MAAGAVGASRMDEDIDTVEPLLTCRPDVLGLLRIDPDREALVVAVFGGRCGCTFERPTPPF